MRTSLPGKATDVDNPGGFVHVPALDGVRGLAILMVLAFHLFWGNSAGATGWMALVTAVWRSTYCGVNLFFTLSGYLITGILLDTRTLKHYFRIFYARRSLRIFPVYYAYLLLLMMLTPVFHFVWSGWLPYFVTYSANIALWHTAAPLDVHPFSIDHLWSLQVEEQFYLVWPLLLYHLRSLKTVVVVSLLGCAAILGIRLFLVAMQGDTAFSNPYLVYSPTFSCADSILFGCCLSALLRTEWRNRALAAAPWVFGGAAMVLLVFAWSHAGLFWIDPPGTPRAVFMPTIGFTLFGICFAALIALTLVRGSIPERLFGVGFLRFFGRYSYGLYVLHYPLHTMLTSPLRGFFLPHLHSRMASVALTALIVALLSVAGAVLSYRFFEEPILRLKRFFPYNREPHPALA